MLRPYLIAICLPVVFSHTADAAEPKIDFRSDIQPLLVKHCGKCHGSRKQSGQLRVDTASHLRSGSVSGAVFIAGRAKASLLLQRLTAKDPDERMPLKGKPLSAKEIQRVRLWIAQGAKLPKTRSSGNPLREHWSYRPPRQSQLPVVKNPNWTRNGIDYFILAELEKRKLKPSPPAQRAQLLRRVFLDLTGLPPTPRQLNTFLSDKSPSAYEEVVDRLLSSPHYGERWARPWLDFARYADSNGYQADQYRSVWPYRDWVIQSMNHDKPFDRFTIEQLAGDLLPNATVPQITATGFHRLTTCNVEAGVDPEENRVNQVIDRVNTTGTVWLATSIGCSQCHNHKYDPFSQREYYQMFAFFNNTPLEVSGNGVTYNFVGPKLNLPMSNADRKRSRELTGRIARLDQQRKRLRRKVIKGFAAWLRTTRAAKKGPKLPPAIARIVKLKRRNKAQRQRLVRYYLNLNPRWKDLAQKRATLVKAAAVLAPTTTLVMVEKKSRMTRILKRGDFKNPGAAVRAQTPRILPSFAGLPNNRLGLANWIANKNNPLTARVAVNRWWSEIFGRGLVATSEDFGSQGDRPTHPKLLDYLAVELMRGDWSMKKLHRLIVTSTMYRQDSRVSRQQLRIDPQNRWLGRAPRFRLPAETIRDNALVISGLMTERMGGHPIYPPQPAGIWRHVGRNAPKYNTALDENRFRRGIYVIWRRSAPYPSFTVFDAPDRAACVVQRPRTNTPLQALTLMNDAAYVEFAQAFARRVHEATHSLPLRRRLSFAFRCCVARSPRNDELDLLEKIYQRQRKRADELPPRRLRQLTGIKSKQPRELAAWFFMGNILLNLDEVITRN